MERQYFSDWISLMNEAKELGLSIEQVKNFIYEQIEK
ncbi:DNA-binding anti-repressor SinI [Priestia sp. YIM B13551]